jgi:uncharacterized protein YnzC (UPF0291/DUF896 family)
LEDNQVEQKKIDRINELSKKSKTEGLSVEEKIEQQVLRQEYLSDFKKSMISTLDSVVYVDAQGNKTPLKKPDDLKQ